MPTSIIDNRDDNKLIDALHRIGAQGETLDIATAFFSLDALLLIADTLATYKHIRILFGDDSDAMQRLKLIRMFNDRSDADLLEQRETFALLSPLKKIERLFAEKRVEARCYTQRKFHAKAYLMNRPHDPKLMGVLGSGNFTRAGLTQNIELNVQLTPEQTDQLADWFAERWAEAAKDVVTTAIGDAIRRQIELYRPYVLYLKALLAWGDYQTVTGIDPGGELTGKLDPHQEIGFRQALRILDREHGAMICDGVGLGKSFVALALMEHYCRRGKRVLLVAPKSVLESSWKGYLKEYLGRYTHPYATITSEPMTRLGTTASDDAPTQKERDEAEYFARLGEQSDVLVIDESHNFRATASARYKNLFQMVAEQAATGRKKVILLTATPINTAFADLSAQLALITHNDGAIAGHGIAALRRACAEMDKEIRGKSEAEQAAFFGSGQLLLEIDAAGAARNRQTTGGNESTLRSALEAVVIQRSRVTCRQLAEAAGKALVFPKRLGPESLEYGFTDANKAYPELIALTEKRFKPGITLLRDKEKAQKEGKKYDLNKLLMRSKGGIKLAAFLPAQYKREANEPGTKESSDQILLAGLVYTNTLKQLESSPVAFQGILQSLGIGLLARLRHVLGDAAEQIVAPHTDWVRTPLFPVPVSDEDTAWEDAPSAEDTLSDGEAMDKNGDESDSWLVKAIQERGLAKKLDGFGEKTHEVDRWTADIVADLGYLKEIHAAILAARTTPDAKLLTVCERLQMLMRENKKTLLFTQSRRTADYLEQELKTRLPTAKIARIDSQVATTRAAILHAFAPDYNPEPDNWPASVARQLDILISTDVLSEGVNLQQAHAIINYDIHWNPVRLIQRIGRVDRRLNLKSGESAHSFTIYNVFPPHEIESIIELVGRVEGRTLKISRTLGLDEAFFKATDAAGTLKEFNAQYEGDTTDTDKALTAYLAAQYSDPPDPETQAIADAVPPGAFGVWRGAPFDGLFALYTLEAKRTASEEDKARLAAHLGQPVLALLGAEGTVRTDAAEILRILSVIPEDKESDVPSDEERLAAQLKKVRNAVRQSFGKINLPSTIAPKLVCWMELRKDDR